MFVYEVTEKLYKVLWIYTRLSQVIWCYMKINYMMLHDWKMIGNDDNYGKWWKIDQRCDNHPDDERDKHL